MGCRVNWGVWTREEWLVAAELSVETVMWCRRVERKGRKMGLSQSCGSPLRITLNDESIASCRRSREHSNLLSAEDEALAIMVRFKHFSYRKLNKICSVDVGCWLALGYFSGVTLQTSPDDDVPTLVLQFHIIISGWKTRECNARECNAREGWLYMILDRISPMTPLKCVVSKIYANQYTYMFQRSCCNIF